jgi:hypothetical protein
MHGNALIMANGYFPSFELPAQQFTLPEIIMKVIDRTDQEKNPFTKFSGHRSYEQIRAECKAQGLILEDFMYRTQGSDWIGIRGKPGGTLVLYSTPTGRFHGRHPATGEAFTESSPFDGEPWFDALLGFFYYTKPHCNA